MAAWKGHHLVVRELLKDPRVDPSADNNFALRMAVNEKTPQVEVVKELLKDQRTDPSKDNSSNNKNTDVIYLNLLLGCHQYFDHDFIVSYVGVPE